MLGLEKNAVTLVTNDYSVWRNAFLQERNRIEMLLDRFPVFVEHVGSTSIPGLPAKPIIDIAIGVCEEASIPAIIQALIASGYQYLPLHGGSGRYLCIKTECETRSHHIHIEQIGGEAWNNHIDFRDCLIRYPDLCERYLEVKQRCAALYQNDRAGYTQGKSECIRNILREYRNKLRSI